LQPLAAKAKPCRARGGAPLPVAAKKAAELPARAQNTFDADCESKRLSCHKDDLLAGVPAAAEEVIRAAQGSGDQRLNEVRDFQSQMGAAFGRSGIERPPIVRVTN
jgi:hypothetical protein